MKVFVLLLALLQSPFFIAQTLMETQGNPDGKMDKKEFILLSKDKSITLINSLENSDFEIVNTLFNSSLLDKLPATRLEQTWKSLENSYGNLIKSDLYMMKETAERNYLLTQLDFEKESFDLEFSLDENKKINSLMILPVKDKNRWQIPSYVNTKQIIAKDTTFGKELPLLANWVYPREKPKNTIVIMVHGSGPNDMDESLGPNKPFKDLAFGLASQGIASLRYNKRTYDYRSKMAKMQSEITIDIEVVNDAVKAVEWARLSGYQQVIIIGHSLGGHMAPKIAELSKADGVIVMAGNVSPLYSLLVPQYEYLMKNDSTSGINSFQVEALKKQVELVEKGDYNSETHPMMLPLGLPASYWRSLEDYKPEKIARKQDIPYLILNGLRDYQVQRDEAEAWKDGSKHTRSMTILYPSLNHAFFSGSGICLPAEYEKQAHVNEKVIGDIANWIKSL